MIPRRLSSSFRRYDRLREHAVSYLSQNYSKQEVQNALPEVIDRIVLGELPNAGEALRSLMGLRVHLANPGEPGRNVENRPTQANSVVLPPPSSPACPVNSTQAASVVQPLRLQSSPFPPANSTPPAASPGLTSSLWGVGPVSSLEASDASASRGSFGMSANAWTPASTYRYVLSNVTDELIALRRV